MVLIGLLLTIGRGADEEQPDDEEDLDGRLRGLEQRAAATCPNREFSTVACLDSVTQRNLDTKQECESNGCCWDATNTHQTLEPVAHAQQRRSYTRRAVPLRCYHTPKSAHQHGIQAPGHADWSQPPTARTQQVSAPPQPQSGEKAEKSPTCSAKFRDCNKTGCCADEKFQCRITQGSLLAKSRNWAQCRLASEPCPPSAKERGWGWYCWTLQPKTGGALIPWPKLKVAPPKDPHMEAEIKRIVGGLTLEQKLAQMVQVHSPGTDPSYMKEKFVGTIISGAGTRIGSHTEAAWLAQAEVFYNAAPSYKGVKVPYMWGIDAVHGHHNHGSATIFPHNIALGAANDVELMKRIGRVTAIELALTGLDWTFAPCLAVPQNARWGRTYEGYSAFSETVARLGAAMVTGLQGHPHKDGGKYYLDATHVLATAKHWIADGGTQHGKNTGPAFMSEEELRSKHAPGYFAAIEAGVGAIMVSFSSYNGLQLHAHEYLINGVLKNALGFDGLVISDWEGHHWVWPSCTKWSCPPSVNAGIDIFMVPTNNDWVGFIENTAKQVRAGIVPMERIDDAVTRILRVKARMGFISSISTPHGKPRPSPQRRAQMLKDMGHSLGAPGHRKVAREAVQKSLVLLKNDRQILPLKKPSRLLVVGRGADSIAVQSGGWTYTWQGDKKAPNEVFVGATTILAGLRQKAAQKGGSVEYSFDGKAARKGAFDAIIAVIAEDPYAEDGGDITVPRPFSHVRPQNPAGYFDLHLLRTLRKQAPDTPVVTVFLTGRPLYTNNLINLSDAFVVAWLVGSEGGGVADVLYADAPVSGHLPYDWPTHPCKSGGKQAKKGGRDDAKTNSTFFVGEGGHWPAVFEMGGGLSYKDNDNDSPKVTKMQTLEEPEVETCHS
ncbi:unnamed protein product [Vitrella brassicaformis CCMP3155]|uniref:P-type domain-containing protein n=1 Tax=Vitrella brassicaformis (strain CCMP3155) TaxID=1169540 RepID=A0A0G4EHS1_VITBC|nr:unnamed protein product [Vitrella brassicaformis CCMP3155]|eukprot:CEL95740.1 unnamed protein product [Vitrella brassicaformis CCMP3155]